MLAKQILTSFVLLFGFLFQTVFSALTPEELLGLRSEHGVIYLNSHNFEQILNGDREYYLSILYTATADHIPCDTCKKFDPQYKLVSKSYYATNPGAVDVFFLIADFTDNEETFKKLQLSTVPKLWVFPPTKNADYNITSPHFPFVISEAALNDPLNFATFIAQLASVKIVIQPDFDISSFAIYFLLSFFSVLLLKKKVLNKVNKSVVLKFLVVISTTILISGYMFTVIRGIPLISKDESGNIMYFSGGQHWQFGLETFIITGIYLTLGSIIVGLVTYIPLIENDTQKNTVTIIALLVLFYAFNYLTKIFLVKDPGYPFQLTTWV